MYDEQEHVRCWIRLHLWIRLLEQDELPIRIMLWSMQEGRYGHADERHSPYAEG